MANSRKRKGRGRERRPGPLAHHSASLLDRELQKARAWLEAGQAEEAMELLEPLREQHPESAPLLQTLGEAYAVQEYLPEAIACYERALALRPTDRELLGRLLSLYVDRRLTSHALRIARRLAAVAPADEQAFRAGNLLGRSRTWLPARA